MVRPNMIRGIAEIGFHARTFDLPIQKCLSSLFIRQFRSTLRSGGTLSLLYSKSFIIVSLGWMVMSYLYDLNFNKTKLAVVRTTLRASFSEFSFLGRIPRLIQN